MMPTSTEEHLVPYKAMKSTAVESSASGVTTLTDAASRPSASQSPSSSGLPNTSKAAVAVSPDRSAKMTTSQLPPSFVPLVTGQSAVSSPRKSLKKPKRPLTAYHIYFKIEREFIIQTMAGDDADNYS